MPFTIVIFTFSLLPLYTKFFTRLCTGCIFGRCKSIKIKSANWPSFTYMHSGSPIASAPPVVAIFKTSAASITAASSYFNFGRTAAKYISRNMSSALLLAGPSVPIARLIPAFFKAGKSAIPLASFALDEGFVTIDTFFSLQIFRSVSSIQTPWKPPPP